MIKIERESLEIRRTNINAPLKKSELIQVNHKRKKKTKKDRKSVV